MKFPLLIDYDNHTRMIQTLLLDYKTKIVSVQDYIPLFLSCHAFYQLRNYFISCCYFSRLKLIRHTCSDSI